MERPQGTGGRRPARERVLAAAATRFCSDGVTATGIDTITADAGVAKMSLYNNFSSKAERVRAYLDARHEEWLTQYRSRVQRDESPRDGPGGVLLLHGTGCVKKGATSAGVGRQCPRFIGTCLMPRQLGIAGTQASAAGGGTMLTIAISVFAVFVSLGSLILGYAASRRSQMPVLQFMWENGLEGRGWGQWWLVNVGTGPATNVVVAQTEKTGLTQGLNGEVWFSPVLVPSIPVGGRLDLPWLGESRGVGRGLGASYTDVQRYFYTTKCGDDVSMFFIGLHLPRWPLLRLGGEKAVKTWWGVEEVAGSRWSPATVAHNRRRWWLASRFGLCRRMGGWADPVLSYAP